MKVAVIGAGRVGIAIAVLLERAGHRLVGVSGRGETRGRAGAHLPGVPVLEPAAAAAAAELVVIGTPDDAIEPTVEALAAAAALAPGAWVLHLSGSLGLDALRAALDAGARRLALHPLQTFPDVGAALDGLAGCWIAVTADDDEGARLGERLAHDLHAVPFPLADELRPLYHAAAVFASNALVTVSAIAESLFAAAGVPDPGAAMAPLQRASLGTRRGPGSRRARSRDRRCAATRGRSAGTWRPCGCTRRSWCPPTSRSPDRRWTWRSDPGGSPPASRAAVEDVLAEWT